MGLTGQRATEIAVEMVTRHGMDKRLGQRTYAPPQQQFLPGLPSRNFEAAEVTMREIDVAVRDILGDAFDGALAVLNARRADLDGGAKLLLAQETITADDFPALHAAKDNQLQKTIKFNRKENQETLPS
ncbi:MAG: hypothetical protein ACXWM1_10040 [Candidatus Binataceae bacterium]